MESLRERFKGAWRVLMAQETSSSLPALSKPVAASSQGTEVAPQNVTPTIVEEVTPLNAALRRPSAYEGMRIEDIESGHATVVQHEAVTHNEYPIDLRSIPKFKAGIERDRAFFAQLKSDGMVDVPIPGNIRFRMSTFYTDFYPEPPADRPSLKMYLGGEPVHNASRLTVSIDVILNSCDEVIEECQKALRAGMALPAQDVIALPAPN